MFSLWCPVKDTTATNVLIGRGKTAKFVRRIMITLIHSGGAKNALVPWTVDEFQRCYGQSNGQSHPIISKGSSDHSRIKAVTYMLSFGIEPDTAVSPPTAPSYTRLLIIPFVRHNACVEQQALTVTNVTDSHAHSGDRIFDHAPYDVHHSWGSARSSVLCQIISSFKTYRTSLKF